jgi:Domain of unknown function (DUF4136)
MRHLAFVALFALAACTAPSVRTAVNPAASFDRYQTFSMGPPEGPPKGFQTSAQSVEVQRRLQPLIAAALEQRGYTPATGKGDLVILFGSGRREVSIHETSGGVGSEWLPADENADYLQGSVVIDAVDGSSGTLVWHGRSRVRVAPDRIDEQMLLRSVQALLVSFPKASLHEQPAAPRADSAR